jgi:Na+/melibiose symporter-like transporter
VVNGTLLIAQVFSLPFYTWLSKRTSKRFGYIVGSAIWMVAMLLSVLITPQGPGFAVYVFAAVVGIGTGGIVVMIYAIFPDIPDADELMTGERREGIYAALITFVRKFSAAVGIFLVSNALDLAGYVAPVEQVVNGNLRLVEQPQSDTFILVLRAIFAGVPTLLLAIALVFAFRYPLTPEAHMRLNRLLTARRAGEEETEAMAEAAEDLKRKLIG